MKLEFENNFESVLNDIVERASSVFGEKPLDEILTDEFIQKNSSFGSLDEFVANSGFDFSTQESFESIPEDQLDSYVSASTCFKSWQDMLGAAAEELIARSFRG